MKKSEVIKLMKEGSICLVDKTPEKEAMLKEILIQVGLKYDKTKLLYYPNNHDTSKDCERIELSEIERDSEKTYLFYEGEIYFFGEEYELNEPREGWQLDTLVGYSHDDSYRFNGAYYCGCTEIRKIDHTSKYKQKLLELREQALKDGVNLKELI